MHTQPGIVWFAQSLSAPWVNSKGRRAAFVKCQDTHANKNNKNYHRPTMQLVPYSCLPRSPTRLGLAWPYSSSPRLPAKTVPSHTTGSWPPTIIQASQSNPSCSLCMYVSSCGMHLPVLCRLPLPCSKIPTHYAILSTKPIKDKGMMYCISQIMTCVYNKYTSLPEASLDTFIICI